VRRAQGGGQVNMDVAVFEDSQQVGDVIRVGLTQLLSKNM
jgi:hypothetical protein